MVNCQSFSMMGILLDALFLNAYKTNMNSVSKSVISLLLVSIGSASYTYWQHLEDNPSTDNAYLSAHRTDINANISGQLSELLVKNNQYVKKGDLLFRIDDKPLTIALKKANADINIAKFTLKSNKEALNMAKTAITQAKAQFLLDKKNTLRIEALVKNGRASLAEGDKNSTQFTVSSAALTARRNQYQQTLLSLSKDKAHLKYAYAMFEQAQLNLTYRNIYAPSAGKIAQLFMRPGNMIKQGQSVFSIIDQSTWWIEANYKETQVGKIKVGQSATITLDMHPNTTLVGHVESISPATGGSFSLLPAENAAGNWVKVTQRIPITIVLAPTNTALILGASARVSIHTQPNAQK